MRKQVERERSIRAAGKDTGRRDSFRRQTFSDEKNDTERLLHNPVLEIEDAETGEDEETEKGKQLVAPFHALIKRPMLPLVNPRAKPLVCARQCHEASPRWANQ